MTNTEIGSDVPDYVLMSTKYVINGQMLKESGITELLTNEGKSNDNMHSSPTYPTCGKIEQKRRSCRGAAAATAAPCDRTTAKKISSTSIPQPSIASEGPSTAIVPTRVTSQEEIDEDKGFDHGSGF
ncbi:hypothetical protein Fot_20683 [Forsythia ovata]|uniref:Uncharacterized protein n=1 Tax=Forsythia ovata TaxID=205694 RepID=A0ABD1UT06_9LAMI